MSDESTFDVEPEYADVSAAYTDLSVKSMMQAAEIAKLTAKLAAKPEPVSPTQGQATYPTTDPATGRIMYGSWLELNDPFSLPNAPRNDPGDVAFKIAQRELAKQRNAALTGATTFQQMVSQPRDENGRPLDEDGNPILSPVESAFLAKADREKELLETPVVTNEEGKELLYPDLPADHEDNADTSSAQYVKTINQRERARNAARINLTPPSARRNRLDREPTEVESHIQAGTQRLREQMYGQVQGISAKQQRINEALARGDMEGRKLASDIMDGRA